MALVVEDGTGLSNADAYVSVAEADAYLAGLGFTGWDTLTEGEKEIAIRRATQYIDEVFTFPGVKKLSTQRLSMPRIGSGVEEVDTWPVRRVKDACCEAAYRARSGSLFADVSANEVESVKVGPIARTLRKSSTGGQQRYTVIDAILQPITTKRGAGSASLRVEYSS